LLLSFF